MDDSNTLTVQNGFEKVSCNATLPKSNSTFGLKHSETNQLTLTQDDPSLTAPLVTSENMSNTDHWPHNDGTKKKNKGRAFPMQGFIKNLPTSIARSNKKKPLVASPKEESTENPKQLTDDTEKISDVESRPCGNCKTLSDLLAINEFTITELKNARHQDAEKFTTLENELKATITRLLNVSKQNVLQNDDTKNLIQKSQDILFKENSKYISQIDSLVKQIEDLVSAQGLHGEFYVATLKLKILREQSEAQENENSFLKNQIASYISTVKGFTKTTVVTLIEAPPVSFTRTHIQEIYTQQNFSYQASTQTDKAILLCSRQSLSEHAVLMSATQTRNASAPKVLNDPKSTKITIEPLEDANHLTSLQELKNEKKMNPTDNKRLDQELTSFRKSKKKSVFKSLINRTSEMIKLSSQQASLGHLQKRKELSSSKPLKEENEETGTRDIQNGTSLDHCSCARKYSVKQNVSNVQKESNNIYELKSNVPSDLQLRNARYSTDGWKPPYTYLESKHVTSTENAAFQKKNHQTMQMQGLHSNDTKNSIRLKSTHKENPIIVNHHLKKNSETVRKDAWLTALVKDKLIPSSAATKHKNAKKSIKNYKHIGFSYSPFKQKKTLEHKNAKREDHALLVPFSNITLKPDQQKKKTAPVKKLTFNEQSTYPPNSSQSVTKTSAETKMRLSIGPPEADAMETAQIHSKPHAETNLKNNQSFVTNVRHSSVRRLRLHSTKTKQRDTLRPCRFSSSRKVCNKSDSDESKGVASLHPRNQLSHTLPSLRKNRRLTATPVTEKILQSKLSGLNCNNEHPFKVIQDVLLVNLAPPSSVHHTVQYETTRTDIICLVKEPFYKAFLEFNIFTRTQDNLEESVVYLKNIIKFIKKVYTAFFEVTNDKNFILKQENLVLCVELFLSKAVLLHKKSDSTLSNRQRIEELQTFLTLEREEHQEKIMRLQRQLSKAQNELIQFKRGLTYNPSVYCAASEFACNRF